MKNLLLDLIVTSGVTAFVLWHWPALLPRVMAAVQPVAAAVWRQRSRTINETPFSHLRQISLQGKNDKSFLT
jgi:hypothetical protein